MRTLFVFLAAAAPVLAGVPSLRELHPRGAQRGKTFTLYLRGENLPQSAQLQTTLPASFSRLTLSKDPLAESNRSMQPNSVLPFLVTLRADTPAGFYPIRVVTPEGISNVLLFTVGDLPELEEKETKDPKQRNDFPAEAEKISIPAVINGTLTEADIDNYVFSARAGQKLVFEVEARRAGSAIDPAIEIFDAAGHELAKNDDAPGLGVDCRVEVKFPKTGEYRVQVHDSKYSQQDQNFYRLKIGSYRYAEALFPLGWHRGEAVEVTLSGGNLPAPVKLKPDLNSKAEFVPLRLPSSASPPLWLVLSDQPEMLEPEANDGPIDLPEGRIVNGRISKPKEIDRYRIRVEPSQKWLFELTAASLGTSQLDAMLTLYDQSGKKLATGDAVKSVDPVLPFTVPKDVKEITIAVEDLLGRGGPTYGYRLQARRQHPDFEVELATPFINVPAGGTAAVAVNIQRRGYDGAIALHIPNLPPGFSVAGGHVPPESAAQRFENPNPGMNRERSVLTVTAAPDVKTESLELSIVAEAQTPDGPLRRNARGPGIITTIKGEKQKPFVAPWLGMQLPMSTTTALPVNFVIPAPFVRIAQGFEYQIDWKVERRSTFKAPVKVNQTVAGTVGNLRILKGTPSKNPDAGSFELATNFATPVTTFDMIFTLQTEIDAKPATIVAPALEVQVVPGYDVRLSKSIVETTPGGKVEIPGTVWREWTFEGGTIRVQPEDLPEQVKCPALEIPAEQKEFVLVCEASPAARPGSFPIRIASVAPNTGRKTKQDYKIPDLTASLVIAGTRQAVR